MPLHFLTQAAEAWERSVPETSTAGVGRPSSGNSACTHSLSHTRSCIPSAHSSGHSTGSPAVSREQRPDGHAGSRAETIQRLALSGSLREVSREVSREASRSIREHLGFGRGVTSTPETSPWPNDSSLFPVTPGPASLPWALFRLLPECSSESPGPGSTSWTWMEIRRRCSTTSTALCPSTRGPTSPRTTTGWSGTRTASTSPTGEGPSAAGTMHRWGGQGRPWGHPSPPCPMTSRSAALQPRLQPSGRFGCLSSHCSFLSPPHPVEFSAKVKVETLRRRKAGFPGGGTLRSRAWT